MAKPAAGSALSHRLSGLHCTEDPREPAGDQQVALSGTGHQYAGSQGAVGPVAGRDRRGKVLAVGPDRAEEPRSGRHPDRVCGWSQGLP